MQLRARHARAHQFGLARLVDTVHSEYVLGEIDTDGQNSHGLLLQELMKICIPIVALVAVRRYSRLAREGEVPFIR